MCIRDRVHTDVAAPKYRLVEIDLANPAPENWKEIIPETENLLQNVTKGGGKLFVEYLQNATSRIFQYNYAGQLEQEVTLPGLGTVIGFSGKEKEAEIFYSFTSFIYPGSIFLYEVKTGKSKPFFKMDLTVDPVSYTHLTLPTILLV